jgi:EAL domain-containing protein (putative c-di-GMP-specific phosphodiesterase class I)
VDDVAAALHESGLPPVSLVLEVTESSVLLDTESGRERLLRLTELGVRLSLDDFGTGYSSLHRLRNLPVSVLKIDKSFVDHVARGHQDRVVVETVITMGHNLGAVVVAEGVETADQLGVLRELGCDAIQGYFYARPLPPDRAAAHFRQLRAAAVGPGVLRLDHSSSGW